MKNTIYAILLVTVALAGFSGCTTMSTTPTPTATSGGTVGSEKTEAEKLMEIAKQCHGKVTLKVGTVRGQTQGKVLCVWEEMVLQ